MCQQNEFNKKLLDLGSTAENAARAIMGEEAYEAELAVLEARTAGMTLEEKKQFFQEANKNMESTLRSAMGDDAYEAEQSEIEAMTAEIMAKTAGMTAEAQKAFFIEETERNRRSAIASIMAISQNNK